MATRNSYDHGTPSWVDLSSPDVDASREFYTALFGWEAEDQFDDEGNRIYTMFRLDDLDVAGLGDQMEGMQGAPPVWMTYVNVDDVDAISEKVSAAGGQVMLPGMDVMDSGRMAVYVAPDGSAISVWQAKEHVGAQHVNGPNSYCWSELVSTDIDAALPFYAEVFGWSYDAMDMGGMIYRTVEGGQNGGLAGLMPKPDEMPADVPSYWQIYFQVPDTDACVAEAERLGATVLNPPMDVPGVGRMAHLMDPHGGAFAVMTSESELV